MEKKPHDYSASVRTKLKDSKEQTQGDILEAGKEEWKVIPKKQEMTTQMRVEKEKHATKPEEKKEQRQRIGCRYKCLRLK